MRRRSILKWIALTAISLTVVLLLASFFHEPVASAQGVNPGPSTQGSLQVLDNDGRVTGECPLKHTAVKAEVSGFMSRVTVTQDFENQFADKIEAVYIFPLPQAAAVDDLTMLIGERVIKGKIMRREEAQSAYAAAKQIGKVASLLDQEQPNIFKQQVANIMPGQRIRIVISYVETLKYEDGAYEWSFPMVVAPRYTPADTEEAGLDSSQSQTAPASNPSPASVPEGTRAGHDISLEIDVDAGVPIVDVNSVSHETEVQHLNEKRAKVRLKDRTTIPNKDFHLTYRIAGNTINDAVLTHRSERGGFFTLILQPPQRVTAEDVMPKELVFVLDTSGSMEGFPLEQAKQTMNLALDKLYPHDTFNLIMFSGDTEILFSEPAPATPENLRKAKRFFSKRKGDGGTEMMKSIKAALDPSDSQQHVRIACFLTDGQVGNDREILAEIQKHPNARVFAIGFGSSPNRFLLDKMAEYGRGEVDYVYETGDMSAQAQRFNDRIRNPLLTDISIDWNGLAVTDVYPKRLPDLFDVKPLILSGRYTTPGKGTIRLKGKMAGQDFVREIPVEFPETESDHDVLATLWSRRKIDELMREELESYDQTVKANKREEITSLGLQFKLMTPYTSFVAIDEVIFSGSEPSRLVTGYQLTETVTVMDSGSATLQNTTSVTSYVTTRPLRDLPLQGRNIAGLVSLVPGIVAAVNTSISQPQQTNLYSINGQPPGSNSFVLDGVSANFGIASGSESPSISASGNVPALTASGGANSIAPMESVEELNITTIAPQPEYGRVAGGQVQVITRSGTNEFHGSLFHSFGNDALDANDWFANSLTLKQPAKRLNLFGGTFSGPIKRDRIFFFATYEGLHLHQPMVGITDVPSTASRVAAPESMRPFLNAFPLPNGETRADGFGNFVTSFANPARHDIGSFKVDYTLADSTTLRGQYTFADSEAAQRGASGFSLNTINQIRSRSQAATGSMTHVFSPTVVFESRANYSRLRVNGSYLLDNFGGAMPRADLFPAPSTAFDLNSRNAAVRFGDERSNLQRQFNLTGTLTVLKENHTLKFGGDYRRISPRVQMRPAEESALFDGVDQALTGSAARVNNLRFAPAQNPVFNTLSLYAQDDWRQSPRLTLVYGLRWELAPPPSTDEPGTSLWRTTYFNFAPRVAAAYQLSTVNRRELILRAGVGLFYDVGQDRSGDIFTDSIPFVSGTSTFNSPFPITTSSTTSNLPLLAYDPHLKLPYTINWHVSLERMLGSTQSITADYVGSSGRRRLHTQTLLDQNPDFGFLRLTTNRGSSDYHAFRVNFERKLRKVASLVSYTLSQSTDNVTGDSARRVVWASLDPNADRGPSDFDVRHQLSGFLSADLPAPWARGIGNKLFRNWALDSIFNVRSGRPLNVVYLMPTSFGVAYLRPDVVSGIPVFIEDSELPGGRSLNPAAFIAPEDFDQGNLQRNSLRGFAFYQIDLGVRRRFNLSERLALQIQTDAFNVLNQANFEDPNGHDLVIGSKFDGFSRNLGFGQTTSMSGRSLGSGGFPSFYSVGGPRAMRFSVKLLF